MKKPIKITLAILIGIFIIMQFFGIDKTNPPINKAITFEQIVNPPANVVALLKKSCYDCHSNETKYPWYSSVAPVSWLLRDHIVEGREHLNFSVWGNYPIEERAEMLEEAAEEITEGKMPLWDYQLMHQDTKMTKKEQTDLVDWLTANGEGKGNSQEEEEEEGEED